MVIIINGERHEVHPIQRVELSIIADKLCGILKDADLESINVTVISGEDSDEEPYRHVRVIDKTGRCDTWSVLWESEDD